MIQTTSLSLIAIAGISWSAFSQTLQLPPRPGDAMSGTSLTRQIHSLPLRERENIIASEILAGNVPATLRALHPVNMRVTVGTTTNIATLYVTPDYLSIGSDADALLTPMTPATAQRIADATDCILPTRKIVDAIHAAANVKLTPQPLAPDARMTTIPVFAEHGNIIRTQLAAVVKSSSSLPLIAGHKKDVVISQRLSTNKNKVAIYGWHRADGTPIQPLYLGHTSAWVDYSHGIRLVSRHMLLNGQPTNTTAILSDKTLCWLLSDEGVITHPRYDTNHFPLKSADQSLIRFPEGFTASRHFDEMTRELDLSDGVRVVINAPAKDAFHTDKPVMLIFFALPNGNTVEWTMGKQLKPGEDWHYNIQHIAAQTRFLRDTITDRTVVVAYLENSLKSWPAWRRSNGDKQIPALLDAVRDIFADHLQEIVLTGHSGGGSLTFGYFNAVSTISPDITRIAFLDSNYAYETTNHLTKLADWLKRSPDNTLCVLAYHDSNALLNGKTFVSQRGGTWGRSHAMLDDLGRGFSFSSTTNSSGLQTHIAKDRKIQFLLQENPDRKILHTVQVERNGFIHAMLAGSTNEDRGYKYWGERAYKNWIQQ